MKMFCHSRKTVIAASFLCVVQLSSSLLLAETTPPEGFGSGVPKETLVSELNLSSEQRDALSCETPFQGRELLQQVLTEKENLDNLLKDKSSSEEAILKQFDQVQAALRDFHLHRLQKILQVRKVLTPKQLERFMELKKEHAGNLEQKYRKKIRARKNTTHKEH